MTIYGSIDVGTSAIDLWVPADIENELPLYAGFVKLYALSIYGDLASRKEVSNAEVITSATERPLPTPGEEGNREPQNSRPTYIPRSLTITYTDKSPTPLVEFSDVEEQGKRSFSSTTAFLPWGRQLLEARNRYVDLVDRHASEEAITAALEIYDDLFQRTHTADTSRLEAMGLNPDSFYVEEHPSHPGIVIHPQTYRSGGERKVRAIQDSTRRTRVSSRNNSLFSESEMLVRQAA